MQDYLDIKGTSRARYRVRLNARHRAGLRAGYTGTSMDRYRARPRANLGQNTRLNTGPNIELNPLRTAGVHTLVTLIPL